MNGPKVTQVIAFKSESTTEIYETHEDAAIAEAAQALSDLYGEQPDHMVPDVLHETTYELAQIIAGNVAAFRKIMRLF